MAKRSREDGLAGPNFVGIVVTELLNLLRYVTALPPLSAAATGSGSERRPQPCKSMCMSTCARTTAKNKNRESTVVCIRCCAACRSLTLRVSSDGYCNFAG